jgi:hypothetical protein
VALEPVAFSALAGASLWSQPPALSAKTFFRVILGSAAVIDSLSPWCARSVESARFGGGAVSVAVVTGSVESNDSRLVFRCRREDAALGFPITSVSPTMALGGRLVSSDLTTVLASTAGPSVIVSRWCWRYPRMPPSASNP